MIIIIGIPDDRNIVIEKADKESYIVIWDINDYVKEAEFRFSNQNVYKSVAFQDKILTEFVEKNNHFLKSLKVSGIILEKELHYFTYKHKKTTGLSKMYHLPKIHKRLYNVPETPVISNCGTPTEKVSEFLDHHLKPVMQKGESYIKHKGDFLNEIKNINLIQKTPFWLLQTWLVFIQLYHIKLVWRYLERHWIKGKHIKYLAKMA